MSKQLDRARANHQKLVRDHARISDRERKLLEGLCRVNARKHAAEKALARSQKRLDKLVAAARHNRGPTAEAISGLIDAVSTKETTGDFNDVLEV